MMRVNCRGNKSKLSKNVKSVNSCPTGGCGEFSPALLVYMKVSYSAKPILSQELSLFVVAGHIESSIAG